MGNNVVVFGSANADLVVEVSRRPDGGETLLGSDVQLYAGGKGANQAAAAARAGADTRFIACVGSDGYADILRANLAHAGVDVSEVRTVDRPTGTAMILVTPDGENSIVVSPGANRSLDLTTAKSTVDTWSSADVLVLNLETPLSTVDYVARLASVHGVRILLNAAPATTLSSETLAICDPLVVNEHEARIILRDDTTTDFTILVRKLLATGARSVIVTLGSVGALVADEDGADLVPAYKVEAVDTTGAGDAFVGATACELARGESLRDAVRFAIAMSALSVQGKGAQSSYADRADVEQLVATRAPRTGHQGSSSVSLI